MFGSETSLFPPRDLCGLFPQVGDGAVKHRNVAFVTYWRSQVTDPEEFYTCLRETLRRRLGSCGVKIFGGQQPRNDGFMDYHVVFWFKEPLHWDDATKKFQVEVERDGKREVDTSFAYVRGRDMKEPVMFYVEIVQAFIRTLGMIFGEEMEPVEVRRTKEEQCAFGQGCPYCCVVEHGCEVCLSSTAQWAMINGNHRRGYSRCVGLAREARAESEAGRRISFLPESLEGYNFVNTYTCWCIRSTKREHSSGNGASRKLNKTHRSR